MSFVRTDGVVRVRALPHPMPRYDFEPFFLDDPSDEALRWHASELVARAIRQAYENDLSMEGSEGLAPDWRLDWGQMIASGTYRRKVRELLADVPVERIEMALLRGFYKSVRDLLDLGDDALTIMMGTNVLDGLASEASGSLGRPNLRCQLVISDSSRDEAELAEELTRSHEGEDGDITLLSMRELGDGGCDMGPVGGAGATDGIDGRTGGGEKDDETDGEPDGE